MLPVSDKSFLLEPLYAASLVRVMYDMSWITISSHII
jgi:hypothetical protein